MKTRKFTLVLALVLLAALLVVAPVQAGRAVTEFTFQIPDGGYEIRDWVDTGPVAHFDVIVKGTVVSGESRLDEGELTLTVQDLCVTPNHHDIGGCWGAAPGTWQIITPGGAALSGWKGTSSLHPWTVPTDRPGYHVIRARGNGFGAYKNMHIEWAVKWQDDIGNAVFSGQISAG